MQIKTFKLDEEKEANEFIESVVVQDNGVYVTSDGIVVFYDSFKEDYENHFVNKMLESLKRNLYHEQVRQVTIEAEYNEAKEQGTHYDNFDDLSKKKKEVADNIKTFETKIKALEEWITNNSSKE